MPPATSSALRLALEARLHLPAGPGAAAAAEGPSPGLRSVKGRTLGAGVCAEAWTARPGDGGPLCFSRGKGTPRAAVPPGCPSEF